MMGCFGSGGPFGMMAMGIGVFLHAAFAALVVMGAIWLFKSITRNDGKSNNTSAVEILKQRYAKGEITSDQFEAMKKEIK